MRLEQFVTTYQNRAPNIAWLLGAGASASSGISTAGDMIWDFKRRLYCAAHKLQLRTLPDLSNASFRKRIQESFANDPRFPQPYTAEEYSFYFEELHKTEADRRKYIDQAVASATPSYGHLCLAAMFATGKANLVWTTNFDRVVEDAAAKVFATSGKLIVSTPDTSTVAGEALAENRWPILVKLHGDFQSRKLKNTSPELQHQDQQLRETFLSAGQRFGLAVIGYSGRDTSIMSAIEAALINKNSFPAGLFWLHRADSPPSERVRAVFEKARALKIDAHLVEAETFDEVMGDLLNQQEHVPVSILEKITAHAPRLSNAPVEMSNGRHPLIRLNALPITDSPRSCRRISCTVGGYSEIREAVAAARVELITARKNIGVLAFGADEDIKAAFSKYKITEFDLHVIETRRLRYDSAELNLIYDGLAKAISRELPLVPKRSRGKLDFVADSSRLESKDLDRLKSACGALTGIIPGTKLRWFESIRCKVELRSNKLWLLITPSVWAEESDNERARYSVSSFLKERLAPRYNNNYNSILEAWIAVLLGQSESRVFSAFKDPIGVNASFTIARRTAFTLGKAGRR